MTSTNRLAGTAGPTEISSAVSVTAAQCIELHRNMPRHGQADSYALRIRGFAQQFRGAEFDMHFSPQQDLTPLRQFLRILRDEGRIKVTTLMERGDF